LGQVYGAELGIDGHARPARELVGLGVRCRRPDALKRSGDEQNGQQRPDTHLIFLR
jgi:hypothetical protein